LMIFSIFVFFIALHALIYLCITVCITGNVVRNNQVDTLREPLLYFCPVDAMVMRPIIYFGIFDCDNVILVR
jgi:hypothetical protein